MPESNHAYSSYQVVRPVELRHCPFSSHNRSDDLIQRICMLRLKHGHSKFQMSASTDFEILLNQYCWKWSYKVSNSVQLLAEQHGTNISWQYLSPIVKKFILTGLWTIGEMYVNTMPFKLNMTKYTLYHVCLFITFMIYMQELFSGTAYSIKSQNHFENISNQYFFGSIFMKKL